MLKINKPAIAPAALVASQTAIEPDLLLKKEKFKWDTAHYSTPIKDDLKQLYHNKCGFCEVELVGEFVFTVEHFRPKSHYWWLGNEWTNLFPTCNKCNNNKAEDFPLLSERNRIANTAVPLTPTGQIDRTCCTPDFAGLLAEKPLFVHPEIDDVENLFTVDLNEYKLKPAQGLPAYQQEQAKKMCDKFLNTPCLVELRKKHLDELKSSFNAHLTSFWEIIGDGVYDEKHLQLAFFPFFKHLTAAGFRESKFSFLGKYIAFNFVEIFIHKSSLPSVITDVATKAYTLFLIHYAR